VAANEKPENQMNFNQFCPVYVPENIKRFQARVERVAMIW
jgi:hypothetical protein